MTNKTTHDCMLLQLPDFEVSAQVDNSDYVDPDFYVVDGERLNIMDNGKTTGTRFQHLCANTAAFIQIGNWIDYLKENGEECFKIPYC